MMGNTRYAGPDRSAWNNISCPPAPVSPTIEPRNMERLSHSSFQSIMWSATRAQGIIVSAHTEYPKVAGNPAFSGISINAPQTPHDTVVIIANMSQVLPFNLNFFFVCVRSIAAGPDILAHNCGHIFR